MVTLQALERLRNNADRELCGILLVQSNNICSTDNEVMLCDGGKINESENCQGQSPKAV